MQQNTLHIYIAIVDTIFNGNFNKNLEVIQKVKVKPEKKAHVFRSVCVVSCECLNQQSITICDNKRSVCLCNCHHMTENTVKVMNNKRIHYFSPIPPRENPHMEFPVNELNSQMFQHLVDPFGICQGRTHHQGGPYMLFPPVSACTIRPFKGPALSLHMSK